MKKLLMIALTVVTLITSLQTFAETKSLPTQPVNINQATKAELMQLPGIGDAKAEAILNFRTEHQFKSVEDLLAVKGIGEKMLEKMTPHISIDGKPVAKAAVR